MELAAAWSLHAKKCIVPGASQWTVFAPLGTGSRRAPGEREIPAVHAIKKTFLVYLNGLLLHPQGLEAGQAEARAEIAAVQAETADAEGRVAALEDKIEALESENAHLESMKVRCCS